jgi:hypothetical protein
MEKMKMLALPPYSHGSNNGKEVLAAVRDEQRTYYGIEKQHGQKSLK